MSKKPVLLFTRKLPDAVENRARKDYDARLNDAGNGYTAEEIVDLAKGAGADALMVTPSEAVTEELIFALPDSVKAIATFSVGFEHIDLEAAKKKGVIVTNTPGVLTNATAEIAMLLCLAAARRAHEGEALLRSGAWEGLKPTLLLGTEMSGKRMGILGMGRIGQAVAKMARGFEMEIHYHNRSRLPEEKEHGARYHDTAEGLFENSDFLSIHCPASPETEKLVNEKTLSRLPDGAIVVNTARGGIVDDAALIEALKSGKVAAAGLDVYDGEPRINPGYLDLDNVFLLPHLGSATVETRNAMGFKALDNLDAIFAGKEPPDRVA